jgi:retinol-binding protein 3
LRQQRPLTANSRHFLRVNAQTLYLDKQKTPQICKTLGVIIKDDISFMNKIKYYLVLIFFPTMFFSQKTVLLNSKIRSTIVNNISQMLLDNYVFPDTAVKMSNCIKNKLKEGAYNKITDPVAFSDALTIDLYSVYRDGHLLVQFVPQQATQNSNVASTSSQINNEDPLQRIKQANFGLKKVEILTGNIGYIDIDHFWADSVYGKKTVKATLQFVSNTNALIIDLRDCGGGSQEAVNMICGYFLEKSTHINDMFDRAAKTTTAYWTKPDSSFTKLTKMPLYILTNNKTFSAAEEFCYDLQSIKRATIIGETTGGGAHGTFSQDAGNGFILSIPYSTAINPITKTSWEKIGVRPEIEVPSDQALETAEIKIFDNLISKTKDSSELFNLKWDLELLKAINNPTTLDSLTLKSYAGVYGERIFTLENGKLFYQRTGRPKFELEAMSPTIMKGKGNTYFKIEFVKNNLGKVDKVNAHYQDNRIETANRTE